jgi:hypothetical protein
MSDQDWDDCWELSFSCVIEVGEGALAATERVMVLLHPAPSVLPFALPGGPWRVALDTSTSEWGERRTLRQGYELAGPAICVLVQAIDSLREPRGSA